MTADHGERPSSASGDGSDLFRCSAPAIGEMSPDGTKVLLRVTVGLPDLAGWDRTTEVRKLDGDEVLALPSGLDRTTWLDDDHLAIVPPDDPTLVRVVAIGGETVDTPPLPGVVELLRADPSTRTIWAWVSVEDEPAGDGTILVARHVPFRDENGGFLPPRRLHLMRLAPADDSWREILLPEDASAEPTEDAGLALAPVLGGSVIVALSLGWDEAHHLPSRGRALVELAPSGEATVLTREPTIARRPAVSADGALVAFLRQRGDPDGTTYDDEVCVVERSTGTVRCPSDALDLSFTDVTWGAARDLFVTYVERAHVRLARLGDDGSLDRVLDDLDGGVAAAATGTVVAAVGDPALPGTLTVIDGAARRALRPADPWVRERTPSVLDEITYRSAHADGREIHALVARPRGAADPSSLPVVVSLHGGPFWWSGHAFDPTREYLVERGFVVVEPNYRGSMGYGMGFLQLSDRRHYPGWADEPSAPHEMGLDVVGACRAIEERGLGDPSRLFLRGESAGALLTTWTLGRTDAFRAATAMSWYPLEWGAPDYGWYQPRRYFDGQPWELDRAREVRRRDVFSLVDRIETPLLLLHGDRDLITPIGDAERLMYALRDRGVEVALGIVPGEGHCLEERPVSRRDALRMEIDWFLAHDAAEA